MLVLGGGLYKKKTSSQIEGWGQGVGKDGSSFETQKRTKRENRWCSNWAENVTEFTATKGARACEIDRGG